MLFGAQTVNSKELFFQVSGGDTLGALEDSVRLAGFIVSYTRNHQDKWVHFVAEAGDTR